MVKEAGLKSVVRINASGCLDACEFGPVAVSYPDGRWYGGLGPEDCERFFETEILEGKGMEEKFIRHQKFDPARPLLKSESNQSEGDNSR
jgi:(2Fe-2S) ferredoxin